MSLHPTHLTDLRKSGLTDQTISDAHLRSVPPYQIRKVLGFDLPGLVSIYEIPYGSGFSRFRAFYDDGKTGPKYLQRKGSGCRLYVPPGINGQLEDRTVPLIITEGEKKALKAAQDGVVCIGLGGLWNWSEGGKLISDFDKVILQGRQIYIVPDNDWKKPNRHGYEKNLKKAVYGLAEKLIERGATVSIIELPKGQEKGLDDYLVKHDLASFLSLPKQTVEQREHSSRDESPYFTNSEGYLCRWKETQHGKVTVRLANFSARIVEETSLDDGAEVTHRYAIEGKRGSKGLPRVEIPASTFGGMNWLHSWGTEAIIEPGQANRDYVRHAIQLSSQDALKKTFFAHTGWREIKGKQVFLTAGGGIGGENVSVRLSPELSRYCLSSQTEDAGEAIRASLSFLDLGNHDVTLPLWTITCLAPLTSLLSPKPNFVFYLYGPTGTFKSTLSILQLAHFGPFRGIESLSSFDDTANSLERRGFILKDVLTILDDYHPSQRRIDAQNKESLAQRIIRAYSNRTGRGRLNSDGSDKGRYEPRGMLQVTGEEIISLESTLARCFVVELSAEDIDKERLSDLQRLDHLLPVAMASYITWIGNHIDEIRNGFPEAFRSLRDRASKEGSHRKLPEQIAFMQYALETALSWIGDVGVLTNPDAENLSKEGWEIFTKLSGRHAERISDEDPVKRFQNIISTLLLQNRNKLVPLQDGSHAIGDGDIIGYFDDLHAYLLPTPLWNTVQRFCIAEGSHFPFSPRSFNRMLVARGLVEKDANGNTASLKKIEGKTMRVLKLARGGIC
jgi:hypothetical protein